MYWSAWWTVFTFFTRRHIWKYKRCLEGMYDLVDLPVNDYISKVPTKMETAIIWEGVLCNLFHSMGRVSLPNIYTTKTTTLSTDYTCRNQARAFKFAITSAPMDYMGD